jgi:manganese transport protein
VANDPADKVNFRLTNAVASLYLVVLVVASVATIPLMVASKAGGG